MSVINTAHIARVSRRHGLRLAVLYGSYARGKEQARSDIDIAALGAAPLSFETMVILQNEFSDAFPGREVDVQSLHRASPFFRFHVMRDGVLLYGDAHLFNRFKVYAIRSHQENMTVRRLKNALIERRQKHLTSLFIHA